MTPNEEKKEITVKAPSKPVVSPEKKAEKTTAKALEKERYDVLQFPKKIDQYIGVATAVMGVLLLSLIAYVGATGRISDILLSPGTSTLYLLVWGFVGLINIITGLLFMGRE